ncbi:MAG TPA: VWA domain-containing protein [Pyrinomonadaceae bacterium]|nr:VWA domain-containing protein [Pyrinomonadaceae bacterium]
MEDTIKIKTRVVFLDALVKDKKTGIPISSLAPDNFEVYDDGKPRNITYFTREGQARKPLALVLILDLRSDGAGRFLKQDEIRQAMEQELAKLPPGDEVAIMAMNMNGEDEKRLWLTEFTNERGKLAEALAKIPKFVELSSDEADGKIAKEREANEAATDDAKPAATSTRDMGEPPEPPKSMEKKTAEQNQIVETETIKGKNGGVVTRTLKRDGSVDVKRTNKKGDVTIELDDVYDMAAAVRDATRKAEQTRPNSQLSIVWVSDGIAPIFFEDRDATEQILIRNNAIFNSLTVELRTLFKFLLPIGKPIAGWMGVSLYGSAKYLAQQSGGEAVKVGRVKDYGTGLSRIFGNLTARYSLGFQLAESETDDGRMHSLEVRVKAQDDKGKSRKLAVSSRQGYYMSSAIPKEAAAVKAQ